MTLDEFDNAVAFVIERAEDTIADEWYATPKRILEGILGDIRETYYGEEIQRRKDFAEYQRLKAIFEGEGK
jgi:hypothetical protein